jgi:hypothetical protein
MIAKKRIRIDRESEANHDLSGCWTSPVYLYKKISFFEQGGKRAFKKHTFVEARECLTL